MAETYEDKLASMSEDEMAKMLEDSKSTCRNFCPECPSYTGTGETELAFCTQGRSKIITEEKGCLCPGCPISRKLSMRWDYYCQKGSGMEQAGIK